MQQQSPPVILEFPTLIEVKCLRIQRPKQNYQTIPLSGIYNDISSVEDTAYPLENKFKNFDICEKETFDEWIKIIKKEFNKNIG